MALRQTSLLMLTKSPISPNFYSPWKHHKHYGFLRISGEKEVNWFAQICWLFGAKFGDDLLQNESLGCRHFLRNHGKIFSGIIILLTFYGQRWLSRLVSTMKWKVVARRWSLKKYSEKVHKIHRKTPLTKSLFNKVARPQLEATREYDKSVFLWLLQRFSLKLFFCRSYFIFFKNTSSGFLKPYQPSQDLPTQG